MVVLNGIIRYLPCLRNLYLADTFFLKEIIQQLLNGKQNYLTFFSLRFYDSDGSVL